MNLWNKPGVPHRGWRCSGVEDIRDSATTSMQEADYEKCEMCDQKRIRFVHIMQHDDYAEELRVGCVCAEKMESKYAARNREKKAKSRAGRKARWLSRQWRESKSGNPFVNVDGHNVVVFYRRGRWSFSVDGQFGRKQYECEDEVKLAAFDEFWERHCA